MGEFPPFCFLCVPLFALTYVPILLNFKEFLKVRSPISFTCAFLLTRPTSLAAMPLFTLSNFAVAFVSSVPTPFYPVHHDPGVETYIRLFYIERLHYRRHTCILEEKQHMKSILKQMYAQTFHFFLCTHIVTVDGRKT